jgi:putative DNA primase/helicase
VKAEIIGRALGGRRFRGGWMARCPAHDDREPSFSIRDGDHDKVLVCCHAGCEQVHVIAALRARGLWDQNGSRHGHVVHHEPRRADNQPSDRDDNKPTEAARRIWQAASPAPRTPVETYLQSRGISIAPPSTIRFHAGLKHPSGSIWPVMVALVTRGTDDTPLAVHRTFLARDGSGKAPVEPTKMMLGPCRGGAVRLDSIGDRLMIAEGIETALSAMQATGHPAWAALSTSGLRALDLPKDVCDVIVLADGDDPGEAAARDSAWRWNREGRRVRIARPPQGLDFNDMLVDGASRIEEGAR